MLKNIIDGSELYFVPCVNPDGYILNEIIVVYNRLSLNFTIEGKLFDQLAKKRDIGSDLFRSKII